MKIIITGSTPYFIILQNCITHDDIQLLYSEYQWSKEEIYYCVERVQAKRSDCSISVSIMEKNFNYDHTSYIFIE